MEPVGGRSTATSSSSMTERAPLSARRAGPLKGRVRVPGDKSISHRALILGALAVGKCNISGLLEGDDVLNTAKAVVALGAAANRHGDGEWEVRGVGVGGFAEPARSLDFGNSGTGCRLMMGAVAGCPITATFDGDASLRGGPMRRILGPGGQMGGRLAGLSAPGITPVIESEASRDHTELMLRHFGATVQTEPEGPHGRRI